MEPEPQESELFVVAEPEPEVVLDPTLKGPKHDPVEGEFFYIKQTRMVR